MAGKTRILDGKAISKKVRAEVKKMVQAFVAERGRAPTLHVVLVGEDPASQVYVRNKAKAALKVGIDGVTHRLPTDTSQTELLDRVRSLNDNPAVDGVLLQLPLPVGLQEQPALDLIDPAKDVDGLHAMNAGLLSAGRDALVPCTPQGCMRLIAESGVELKGANALVIGRSNLVGKPVAQLLLQQHVTLTIAHSRTRDLPGLCQRSDVVIAAVGRAQMVKGDWIKPNAVVIDVGINQNDHGNLVGDVDFEGAKEQAGAITPVPGGVGPMTIAYLLRNTVLAAKLRLS